MEIMMWLIFLKMQKVDFLGNLASEYKYSKTKASN